MSWSAGEVDGKEVGYGIESVCEHPDCEVKIDKGLSYACGDHHGCSDIACDGYFCWDHLLLGWGAPQLCYSCSEEFDKANPLPKKYLNGVPEDSKD